MKTPLLIALLAGLFYYYYHDSSGPTPAVTQPPSRPITTQVVIAAMPSYQERWKTGPTAQTDLKTGPDAQTHFEPFAPSEHATWNQGNPGYTIIAGANVRPF